MTTTADTRRSEITEILERERYLKVADLQQRFGVSHMSIRRDLTHLEEQGLLRRVHGGLIATPFLRLGLEISPKLAAQTQDGWLEKEEIAQAAAALVQPGEALIFDSGILSYLTACALPGDVLVEGDLTVITNSLPVALELAPWQGVETILLGGEYQANGMMDLSGPSTLRSLEGLHADKMFLTVQAIEISHGVTVPSEQAALSQKMIAACADVVLLAARCKIGQVGQVQILPTSAVRTLITVPAAPEEFVSYLIDQGTDVILA